MMDITEAQYGELIEAEKEQPIETTEEQKDQNFITAYTDLCKQHNRTLSAKPDWSYSQDMGDFRLTIKFMVSRVGG